MARKTKIYHVASAGRDTGKHFLITEMPASQAERWAQRALMAMGKAGVEMPDDFANSGLAGIAVLGMKAIAGMPFADAGPLLDEMMRCVQFIPSPDQALLARPLIEDDIEEVTTRLALRSEVIELHTGFSITAALVTQKAATTDEPPLSITPT